MVQSSVAIRREAAEKNYFMSGVSLDTTSCLGGGPCTDLLPSCPDGFWEKTGQAVRDLGSSPMAIFSGAFQGVGLIANCFSFAKTFDDTAQSRQLKIRRTTPIIVGDRVLSGMNLAGSAARVANWIHTEIFWGAGGAMLTGFLTGFGYGVGVVRSGARAFDALDQVRETNRLVDKSDEMGLFEKKEFKNTNWIHALTYASNFFFMSFCVVGILSLIIGSALLPPLAGILLFGSLVTMIATLVMKLGNKEEQKLELLKAADTEKDYTYRA